MELIVRFLGRWRGGLILRHGRQRADDAWYMCSTCGHLALP